MPITAVGAEVAGDVNGESPLYFSVIHFIDALCLTRPRFVIPLMALATANHVLVLICILHNEIDLITLLI